MKPPLCNHPMIRLAAAAALLLASLGTAHAAAQCGANTGKKATGEPIVIAALTGRTGPDDFSSSTRSAKAYFDCLNANGGIHGRPVQYLIEDDQWRPEMASQLAARLVNDRKAVLMVGNSSYVDCGANADFYKKAGILAIAGVGVPRECFFAEHIAPVNTGPRVSGAAATQHALQHLGAKSVVCIAPNVPNVGTWMCEGITQLGQRLGFTTKTLLADLNSADSTSLMLQAAALKPDAIVLGFSKGVTVPLLEAAEEQGLNESIQFLSTASAYELSVPAAIGPGWDGKFMVNMEFNELNAQTPDNLNWRAVMDEYGQRSDPRDSFSQAGYLAARIAEKALMSLKPDAMTRENINAALAGMKFESDILCAPWYLAKGQTRHNANSTTRMSVSENGKWKVISKCAASPDPELDDVRAYERSIGIGN